MATFPSAGGNPLGIKVELLSIVSAGVWTDISSFVLLRNPVQISGMGRTDWTSTLQAASLTLTLRNDGRFTPKLAAGAYFPNITRNTQIRVSAGATSATGVAYPGSFTTATGGSTSPAAFTTWAGTSVPAGTYTVPWSVTLSGTTGSNDVNNFVLKLPDGTLVTSVNPSTPGTYAQAPVTFSTSGGNLFIQSGSHNATAGAVYSETATGATAAPYRFWGEVAAWPPAWTPGDRNVYVDITAYGIWHRMSQLATTLGSAYTRYNSLTLTGTSAPRCYWPMEDGAGSGSLVAYDSVAGTGNATQSWITGTGLSLAACTDFKGSDGIPQLNAALIAATVPAGGTPTNNVTRFLLSVPANGDSASGTVNWDLAEINSAGTVAKFEVLLMTTGTLRMYLRNSGGTVLATADTTTNVRGQPYLVSCELTPSGGNVAFALRLIKPGAAGITESMTGTLTTASVGAISLVRFSRGNTLMDTAVGHLSVTYGAVPSMVSAANALGGYVGEKAMDRFTRICGEMGIAAETIGTASTTAAMGPQVDDTLTDVLQSIEDVDMGLLFESRTQFGLGYRALTSMTNQAAAATISYTAGTIDPSLATAYDDQLTRNNVTVTNQSTGYTQQAILTAGSMSISNPPSGIGNGYGYERTVNAAADGQIAAIANWLLNVGGVDEIRLPVVTLKMVRASLAPLFAAIPGIRPGDYLQITNPPAFLAASTIKQLAFGYTETMGPREWTFAFNTGPETPYETGFSPGTVQTAQIPGSGPVTSTAPGAGGLGGIIQNGSISPSMLNQGITVKTIGGNRTTIAASAPANPDLNDIWISSTTALISQWNGTTWTPFKFDASATIQAGTIVASNIAASTITSGLLAAGIVVAGIVDATTITGAQIVATGTAGEILVYSGTPAAGNLIGAWSGSAGSDTFGNAFAADLTFGNLTAIQPGSSPTALETWHTLAPIGNGWTTNHGRYRRTAENEIQLDVSLTAGGSPTYGTLTWPNTMPAAYRPIVTRRLAGVPSAGSACHSTINTTGVVSSTIPSPAGTFDCCGRVPLD